MKKKNTNDARFYTNTDRGLTLWQQECETKIVRHQMNKREAELLRSVYELANVLASTQHWAGTSYSQLLIDRASERIAAIPYDLPIQK